MSTEQGVVEQVEPGWAWVKAKRLGAPAAAAVTITATQSGTAIKW